MTVVRSTVEAFGAPTAVSMILGGAALTGLFFVPNYPQSVTRNSLEVIHFRWQRARTSGGCSASTILSLIRRAELLSRSSESLVDMPLFLVLKSLRIDPNDCFVSMRCHTVSSADEVLYC